MDEDDLKMAFAEAVSLVFASIMLSWMKLSEDLTKKVQQEKVKE